MVDASWSGEAKYKALLAVAEAANSRLDLSSVLDAVADAFTGLGLVPVDAIGVITRHGPLGVHSRDIPRGQDESQRDYLQRMRDVAGAPDRSEIRSTAEQLAELERTGETLVVNDVRNDTRLKDLTAKRSGAECFVLAPLANATQFVGGIAFARMTRTPFSADEVRILEDISRPVATAVANALAFEEIQALRARVEEENRALKEEIDLSVGAGGIIGASSGLSAVLDRVQRVAGTDTTVLITGETGTGKELIARAIHRGSGRTTRALIKVNCAAFAEGLVASELFGHEKGAFTGALERRRGRFELATGGTIFLDEIGELPAAIQVMLLRVLQDGEFERVGGSQVLKTDARVVAATNRNLEQALREGRFRGDLFFRLNVFPIHVPALRERQQDIPLLAEYYARHYARKIGKPIRGISAEAMSAFARYTWPGNVRELQNVVERAVILAHGPTLEVRDLEISGVACNPGLASGRGTAPDAERHQIEQALAASRGRVSGVEGAAAALGVPPSTLESRIQRLGIDKSAFRRRNPQPGR